MPAKTSHHTVESTSASTSSHSAEKAAPEAYGTKSGASQAARPFMLRPIATAMRPVVDFLADLYLCMCLNNGTMCSPRLTVFCSSHLLVNSHLTDSLAVLLLCVGARDRGPRAIASVYGVSHTPRNLTILGVVSHSIGQDNLACTFSDSAGGIRLVFTSATVVRGRIRCGCGEYWNCCRLDERGS